jgi:hypothetical protein
MSGSVRLLFLYAFMTWRGTALPLIIIIIIITVITGATRIVTKGLKKQFGSHIRNIFNRLTTKAAKPGTSHVLRKVLQCATGSLRGGDRRWFRRSVREKRLVIGDNIIIIIIN